MRACQFKLLIMRSILLILFLIIQYHSYAQEKKVFYYVGTGSNTLTLTKTSFNSIGKVGLAHSIEDTGVCTKSGDTLFLKRLTKTLFNKSQQVDNTNKVDTFLVVDDETIAFINGNNYSLYKLIEIYNYNVLKYKTQYSYLDTVVNVFDPKMKKYVNCYTNNYPVKNGPEIWYEEGMEVKRIDWKKGELKN